jgi:hypothetical protein
MHPLSRFNFIRVASALTVVSLLFPVPQVSAAAPPTCQFKTNTTWSTLSAATLTDCAVTVGVHGAQAGQTEARGRWNDREFTVVATGVVTWTATGQRAGLLPDLDSDSLRYDACPTEAETVNNVFDSDGCPDSLQDLMDLVTQDLDAFWGQTIQNYASPRAVTGYRQRVRTACGRAPLNNAFYCAGDASIYYDARFLERLLRGGDFGPVAVLAHEWGHLAQDQLGLQSAYSIQVELQADCLAGAYAQHLAQGQSQLLRLEAGDLEEGASLIYKLGDPQGTPWNDSEAHGTSAQRYAAFMEGEQSGVTDCVKNF